jgi:hypothetical protein
MGSTSDPARTIARSLVLGGIVAIVVGGIAGALVEPYLYAIAAVALIDFALAWAFASGRLGSTAERRRVAQSSGDLAAEAEADPSFNPYARED